MMIGTCGIGSILEEVRELWLQCSLHSGDARSRDLDDTESEYLSRLVVAALHRADESPAP
jgi:hypothetical protein